MSKFSTFAARMHVRQMLIAAWVEACDNQWDFSNYTARKIARVESRNA